MALIDVLKAPPVRIDEVPARITFVRDADTMPPNPQFRIRLPCDLPGDGYCLRNTSVNGNEAVVLLEERDLRCFPQGKVYVDMIDGCRVCASVCLVLDASCPPTSVTVDTPPTPKLPKWCKS